MAFLARGDEPIGVLKYGECMASFLRSPRCRFVHASNIHAIPNCE